ncbi:amino acid transporter [Ascoidea rubescens DSM 1968]|uniref:Amino acid transporter n=1 Tax=Ascoidea rubescens DSM 1968 TaxID=1344418 RepID=A0A1D2VIC7_9ASCO|nr:amino acid transporter [Ascoidea rubescens DSM 1968]ODV61280.1 amino acid transporter [Ascoidea rubescens DSM 1968]
MDFAENTTDTSANINYQINYNQIDSPILSPTLSPITSQIEPFLNSGLLLPSNHQNDINPIDDEENLFNSNHPGSLSSLEELPQGRNMGLFSTILLFISRIVGSGIFATPASIFISCGGSPFLFFLAWIIAAIITFSGLYIYLELGSLMPRSGGTKVFLEVIYYKPTYLISVVFSLYSVLFGFVITNAIIFGEYFLYSCGFDNENQSKNPRYVGVLLTLITTLIHGYSVKTGILINNIVGSLKLILLFIMTLTGFFVLVFPQSITKIDNQLTWSNFFQNQRTVTLSSFSAGIFQAIFSFSGWNNVHTVASEIKNPVKTLNLAGPVSLIIILISYFFTNIAYLKVVPHDEIFNSGQLIGSLLFEKIFGYKIGRQLLTMSVALSAGGNVFVVLYAISRMNQEVFREGYLPFASLMASNKPFGAPLPALLLSLFITTFFMLVPPAGNDVYSYIVNLESYPFQLFMILVAIGVLILRKRFPKIKAPVQASYFGIFITVILSVVLAIAPFTANDPNNNIKGFPSYSLMSIIILLACVLYWFGFFIVLPYLGKYTLRPENRVQEDGLVVKEWVKLPIA